MFHHHDLFPFRKSTKILREAEPEPRRAKRDKSLSDRLSCNASLHAVANAA